MTADRPPATTDGTLPLAGIRVLDLSRLVAGNMLTLLLADFGADVIKVEDPETGDALREWKAGGASLFWKVYARNKRSITLDLRVPEGRALLLQLAQGADVLVESFKFGTLEKMGCGPEVLLRRNPALVIVRISGFGQTGPYRTRPGFGTLIEAMSGFAAKTGFPRHPPVLPNVALADMVAGTYGAFAVVTAMRAREQHGAPGQVIDLSLLEPLISVIGPDAAVFQATGEVPIRIGNRLSVSAPRNVYHTRDGRFLAVSASMQPMFEHLMKAIGHPELIDDARFRTNSDRVNHVDELDRIIDGFISARTLEENVRFFEAAGVTAAPVYDVEQLVSDEHVIAREVFVAAPDPELGSVLMHNITPRLMGTPGRIRTPAPELGEHNGAVFGELGYDARGIAELRAKRVI
jgi:crotonobetainyl-CoA:carnitine CoA-transferase CaiB-like acyl-CoA transferase